eukprot:3270398-Rhodomonas_salina.2
MHRCLRQLPNFQRLVSKPRCSSVQRSREVLKQDGGTVVLLLGSLGGDEGTVKVEDFVKIGRDGEEKVSSAIC